MELLITLSLYIHILCGTIALLAAPVAIVLRNKTPRHRVAGRFYFYSMLGVTVTALVISLAKTIPFLFMVAIFSFYSIWEARRAIGQKMLHKGQKPCWYDWVVSSVVFIVNTGLLVYGIVQVSNGKSLGWVAVIFALIGLVTVVRIARLYFIAPKDPKHWLYRHIQGMMGGYIATVTAFLVVNNTILPPVVAWMAPTVIGSLLITRFMIKVRRGGIAGL